MNQSATPTIKTKCLPLLALQAVGVTGLVDKVLHGDGDGQAKAQAAAQEASFSDAEAAAYGGVTPKADKAAVQEPSGESCFCTERTQSQEAAGFCAITVTKSRARLQISARNWASNGCNSGLCGRGVHDRCCLLEHLWNSLRWPAGDAADREPPYSDMAAVAFAGSAPAHHAETAAESAPEAEAAPEAKAAPEADTMPTTTSVSPMPAAVPHPVSTAGQSHALLRVLVSVSDPDI